MGQNSQIQWTDATWNVARGCTKVSEGCKYCYMMRDSMDSTRYNPEEVIRTKTVFNLPLKLDAGTRVFTSSLTDFFHPAIDSYREECWNIIRQRPDLYFQILTKRPERMATNLPADWTHPRVSYQNVWLGTSIEMNKYLSRIVHLATANPATGFLSLEPLLEDLTDFNEYARLFKWAIDWVIIGGESGNDKGKYLYRPCQIDWMERIVDTCKQYDIPVFVKQMGTYLSKQLGMSDRHGSNIEEFPKHLQLREMPKSYQRIQDFKKTL